MAIIFLELFIRFRDALLSNIKLLYTSSTLIIFKLSFVIFKDSFIINELAPILIASLIKLWPSNSVPGIAKKIFPGFTFLLSISTPVHVQSLSIFLLKILEISLEFHNILVFFKTKNLILYFKFFNYFCIIKN